MKNIEIVSITQQGNVEIAKPEYKNHFFINSLFVSAPGRTAVNSVSGSYVPIFLSEIPILFRKNILPLDVAMVMVSPPDKSGYCTLGTFVDAARSAVGYAKKIVAAVNPKMPRTHGEGFIPIARFTHLIWHKSELPSIDYSRNAGEIERKVGKNMADLVENQATLQMEIGTISDAVL